MQPRDIIRIHADKLRVAVIFRVESDDLRLITGSTQDHDLPRVSVSPDSRQGRKMELREMTYFYARDIGWFSQDQVEQVLGKCSGELFLELARLDEEGLAE